MKTSNTTKFMVVVLAGALLVTGYLFWINPTESPSPDTSKLIGRWVRADGGYVLAFSDPVSNGLLKATYFNPRPINVSHAEWKQQDGSLGVSVELRDAGYPGSTYTLTYNPATDTLAGNDYQAVAKQDFTVEFKRSQ